MERELKKAITPARIKAAKTVFMAMAYVETIRPKVEKYQRRILEIEKYPYSEEAMGRREKAPDDYIKKAGDAYLMSDGDAAHFFKRLREERDAAGFKVKGPDNCPLLEAEQLLREAQRALVDLMEPVTGITHEGLCCIGDGLESFKKYIDLTLKLFAPYVDAKI